jgi:hypothetical protein
MTGYGIPQKQLKRTFSRALGALGMGSHTKHGDYDIR